MGKIVPLFQRIIQWSVVPRFTKHYVDNEVLMLWEKQSDTFKELSTGVQCPLSQNITLIMKCLCYGKNSPTLLKNYQLECSAPFTKHNVDNEVVMLWEKQSYTIKELRTGVQCPFSQNIMFIIKRLCYGKNSTTLSKNNLVECSAPFHKTYVDNEVVMLWENSTKY